VQTRRYPSNPVGIEPTYSGGTGYDNQSSKYFTAPLGASSYLEVSPDCYSFIQNFPYQAVHRCVSTLHTLHL